MKKYKSLYEEKEQLPDEIYQAMSSEMSNLRKKYKAMATNQITIKAASTVAKQFKIKPKDILKYYIPSNNIRGEKTWDKEGNIK